MYGKICQPEDGPVISTEVRYFLLSELSQLESFSLYLMEERPVGVPKGRAAAQPNGDRHVGWIPRGIDGLPKALGELGGAAECVSLLQY